MTAETNSSEQMQQDPNQVDVMGLLIVDQSVASAVLSTLLFNGNAYSGGNRVEGQPLIYTGDLSNKDRVAEQVWGRELTERLDAEVRDELLYELNQKLEAERRARARQDASARFFAFWNERGLI